MRTAKISLASGLTVLAGAIALTLLKSPVTVARTNRSSIDELIVGTTHRDATYCQGNEYIPAHTSAARMWLAAYSGPRLNVVVSKKGRSLTSGHRASGWTSASVTIPIRPLDRNVSGVTICVSFHLRDETITVEGIRAPASEVTRDGPHALGGRMSIEYMRSGKSSWVSAIPEVVRSMSFGRATTGSWIVYVALMLLVAVIGLASRLVLTELR